MKRVSTITDSLRCPCEVEKMSVGPTLTRYLDFVDDNDDTKTRADVLLLSGFEMSVLDFVMSGNSSTRSIAKSLNVSRKNVEKAMKKCEKLSQTLKTKYGDIA